MYLQLWLTFPGPTHRRKVQNLFLQSRPFLLYSLHTGQRTPPAILATIGENQAHPVIDADECICCGVCVDTCPTDTLELGDECAVVANEENCIACGQCMEACPTGAITEIVED